MSTANEGPSQRLLAPRLRSVHVGLREDLDVSRHLFRGEPSYIVRDPMTFQSQRLSLADYAILVRIDAGRPLSESFDELVESGKLSREDEERFYRFVMSLHSLGFLHLPISDDKLLYRRHLMRAQARRRAKAVEFLFLRIPLWNPDAFLERTVRLVRPVFSRAFFIAWVLIVVSAGIVAVRHWNELVQPLQGVLAARNLPLMWLTLIGLKVFHEMGHAYACKHYGGHVPEMGAYLVVFTPCAYMDASASWGFVRKRERIIVCLAGMYVEALVAAAAVFVWATTEALLLKALAYNVIFLASVVTVLFNMNPLLRYDGYYIFSDLVEVPNLRSRSRRCMLGAAKRLLLGLEQAPEPGGARLRMILLWYGVAATIYRVFLILAITAVLVSKMFLAGVVLGVCFLGGAVLANVRRLLKYLLYAEETASRRGRAVALSLIVFIAFPAGLAFVPLPSHVQATALVCGEQEAVVRATSPGFLERVRVECGQTVNPGDTLAELENDDLLEEIAHAGANLKAAQIRRDAYLAGNPVQALQEEAGSALYRKLLDDARSKLADLHVRAPNAGRIVECLRDCDVGKFLNQGSAVATIIAGKWRVRAVLTADEISRVQPRVGDTVAFRALGFASRTIEGVVAKVAPAGSRLIEWKALTHIGGGDIAVNPVTHEAVRPYFEVIVELRRPDRRAVPLRHGMTGTVRFAAGAEPVAKSLSRRFARFWNRLLQG